MNKLLEDMREQAVIHPRRIFNREGTGSAKAPRKIHLGHLRTMKEAGMAEGSKWGQTTVSDVLEVLGRVRKITESPVR